VYGSYAVFSITLAYLDTVVSYKCRLFITLITVAVGIKQFTSVAYGCKEISQLSLYITVTHVKGGHSSLVNHGINYDHKSIYKIELQLQKVLIQQYQVNVASCCYSLCLNFEGTLQYQYFNFTRLNRDIFCI